MKKYIEILVDGHWLGHRDFAGMDIRANDLYAKTYPNDVVERVSWVTGAHEYIIPGREKWSLGLMLEYYPEHIRLVEEAE